jgi:hypothetical protein
MNRPRRPLALTALLLATLAAGHAQPAPAAAPAPPAPPEALYLTWQHDPVTTMTIHWLTDWQHGYRDTVLEYRAAAGSTAAWTRALGSSHPMPYTTRMVHTVELTGLESDTIYEFRLGALRALKSGEFDFIAGEARHRFRTLPAALSRPVCFVSGGDANLGAEYQYAEMNRVAASHSPDFALMGGDIAYVNNHPKDAGKWFDFLRIWTGTMLTPDGRIIPIVPAIGNHEVNGDAFDIRGGTPETGAIPERGSMFYSLFSFPGVPGYNVLDAGTYLSVVALDTFHTSPVPGPQTDWLRGVLERRRGTKYLMPMYHVGAYPSHRSASGPVAIAIRANWVPLFEAAGVRFVFENHDHTYKVTYPLLGGQRHPDGIRYLGDGAWSVATRDIQPPAKAPYLERAYSRNHVFVVTLHPDRADFVSVDPAGAEFDRFSIDSRR